MSVLAKVLRFGVAGVAMIVWAFALNILLNEKTTLQPTVSYVFVVVSQLIIGFVLNRLWVFRTKKPGSAKSQLTQYVFVNSGLKVADWSAYSAMVTLLGLHYLIAQLISTGFISIVKFFIFDRIFSVSAEGFDDTEAERAVPATDG
jgi:putative flippase GtrA